MPRFLGFLGSTVSQGGAFAVGQATAPTLSPLLQDLANETWALHPSVPLDVAVLAEGVASGEISMQAAKAEAKLTGYDGDRFEQLVQVVDVGPGVAQAFRLWRRDKITDAAFKRALKRAGLEQEWIDALAKTKDEPLTAETVANAIQQGFIPSAGILPDPIGGDMPFDVPTEQVNIGPIGEAEASGVPSDRLKVLAYLSGNPPGPETLASLWNRGIITEAAFEQGIREGRTKTKWIPALKQSRFALLTGIQAVNLWLRGWISEDAAKGHARKVGYTDELTELLFKGQGRPLSMRQAFVGRARGGVYNGPTGDIPDYFLTALRQSSIRPEWYNLAWAQRHSLPSAFVLRSLVQGGDVTQAEGRGLLIDSGWPEDLATKVAASWAGGTVEGADAHVKKGQVQLWTATHSAFLAGDATDAVVRDKLPKAGVAAGSVSAVLALWKEEREVIRQRMTPTQVKKAYKKAVRNTATSSPWTRDDALAELLSRGWSSQDANAFLDQ